MPLPVSAAYDHDSFAFAWIYGGHSPPEPTQESCASAFTEAYSQWQIAGAITQRILEWGSDFRHLPVGKALYRRSICSRIVARAQLNAAREIDAGLGDAGLPRIFFKAVACQVLCPITSTGRCGADIDLGIRRGHLREVSTVLRSLGYVPCRVPGAVGPFRQARHFEATTHEKKISLTDLRNAEKDYLLSEAELEVFPLDKGKTGPEVCLSVDIHLDIGHDMPIDFAIDASRTRNKLTIPAESILMVHNIMKIYFESLWEYRKNMHLFFDLINMVSEAPKVELQKVVDYVRELNLMVAAFYVLRRLPISFNVSLPSELEPILDEGSKIPEQSTPLSCNDFGDMWPKMIGER